MRSLSSLPSQKTGAIYSLVLLVAVMALVVGILSVIAAHDRTMTFLPKWAGASVANQTYNITITNDAGSAAAINEIRITKPSTFVDVYCLSPVTAGWQCTTNGTFNSLTYIEFTAGSLAAGATASFNISSTTASSSGENGFTVRTNDGAASQTSTHNVSIDTSPPKINLINVSDGTRILSSGDNLDGLLFLSNSTSRIDFIFNATDNESGISQVTFYYNTTNTSDTTTYVITKPDHRNAATYEAAMTMGNGSWGSASLFNASLTGESLLNGTRIVFTVVANDTVRNGNVSNYTSVTSDRVYNLSIDAAAPRFRDVLIANASEITTGPSSEGINTTKTFGSTVKYILNSTLRLNVSAVVSDDGGSGVIRVQIMNRSGVFTDAKVISGTNGSSGQTIWNSSSSLYNISDLVRPNFNGDGLYNISFRITDNVSNVVNSNFTVEVDDTGPTGAVSSSNLTIDGKLSEGNITLLALTANTNTTFVLRVQTSNNINNVTRNVSVFGNKGLIHNLTYESGTPSGTSFWNISIGNNITGTSNLNTTFNLSEFCDLGAADGSQCNFRFNFSDVLGRFNDSLNLTVATDAVAPNVTILSPVSLTTNYSTSVLINASVNDSVGPLRNVSFRWKNSSSVSAGDSNGGANASSWFPMTLNTGTNSQFNAKGYWTATLDLTTVVDGNYSIEINATDSSGRQNTSVSITNVIFDSTKPLNISIRVPATNSFHRDNTTFTGRGATNITAVANETRNAAYGNQSGIFNVSFRLENSSFNWSWVPSVTYGSFGGLVAGVLFSPDNANFTNWGGELTNASNGGFTIRLNVTDTAGNQNTSVTINVTIDTVLPTISFLSPVNSQNKTGNFTINASVTESNVNTVQFRWVNDSSNTAEGRYRGPWVTMTGGTATTFNGTFSNLTVTPALSDGNYTIELNITDKAGWNVTTYIQLILDNNQPLIAATGTLGRSNQTGNFVVNLTINDTGSWIMGLGKINTTNINSTTFRLENSTFNGSWVSMAFATTDMENADSNRTNATFTFSSVANGLYDIRFMVNDTAGNQNNSVRIRNIMLDNVAPGVAFSTANVSPAATGGAGLSGNITFNASITDNLPVNTSIVNETSVKGNSFGVFYRFESASVTTSWLPMGVGAASSTQANTVVFNASNVTTSLADGDYKIRINVTDSAGNQNTSVYIDITVQNGASNVKAKNLTFLEGIWNGLANSSTGAYTFLVNTTANATCRYSLDTAVTYYDDMTSTMSNNVSRAHRISFGPQRDVASGGHTLYYACKDVSGNFTASEGAASQFQFGIDTRNRWNVTIPGKTDSKWPNYFQPSSGSSNAWSSFVLATGALADTTLASPGTYNVTSVLSSLMDGTAAGNFSRIYAYTASSNSWETFVVGRVSNSFTNFTNQTTYWINVTAVERLEIN